MNLLNSLHSEENHQFQDNNNNKPPLNIPNSLDINNNNIIHQELSSLISKQSHHHHHLHNNHPSGDHRHRRAAVEWILQVVSHHSFTTITAVLAADYLDTFLDRFEELQMLKKQWMMQLVAVACVSIAAKVEETCVPLLVDLQIDGSEYVFEGKTIQRMEVLVMSTLQWKMNPVTPLSFVDCITRRLRLKACVSSEFIKRCECLILCFLPDDKFRCHLPSVIATATMLHVINTLQPSITIQFQSQLLNILGINKKEVDECCTIIEKITRSTNSGRCKRKVRSVRRSPDDVMGLSFSSDESSSPEPEAKKCRNVDS